VSADPSLTLTVAEWRELRLRFALPENAQRFVSVAFGTLHPKMAELEEWYVWMVLGQTDGQPKSAARVLGMDPSTLYRKLQAWDRRDGLNQDPLLTLFDKTAAQFGKGSRGGVPRL
jgi:DNA-binding NtrC family response regulator